jgi:uncharacterized protein (DUF4415 family)
MSIASRKTARPAIVIPTVEEDATITAAALSDPDAQPLTDAQLAAMVPMKTLRGRPRTENPKRLVSVRYSPEVITYFKSTGDAWQARVDGVLREYVAQQARRSS